MEASCSRQRTTHHVCALLLPACLPWLQLAVCAIELWPEARSCKNDRGLVLGIVFGSIAMLFTLVAETLHEAHKASG